MPTIQITIRVWANDTDTRPQGRVIQQEFTSIATCQRIATAIQDVFAAIKTCVILEK